MSGRPPGNTHLASFAPVLIALVFFVADIATPRGVSICVAYAPLVCFALWMKRPGERAGEKHGEPQGKVYILAVIFTVLTVVAGFFKAPAQFGFWVSIVNRSLSLGVLWLAAVLIHRYRDAEGARHNSEIQFELGLMQREIHAEKLRLANIVESSDDAILSKSLGGIIESWNRGAERLFGYTAQEAIGQPITMLIPEELLQEEKFILSELVRGKLVDHFETVRLHKSGRRIDVSITVSPVRDAFGTIIGASKVARDISARKQVELEFAEYTRALALSNKALDDFAYAASHDLKAPLRVIDNAAKWLEEDLQPHLTAATREHMQLLRGRVRRLEKLLDDLLAYSRIGRKLDREFVEPISGDALIQDVLALLVPPDSFAIDVSPRFASIQVCRMPLQEIFLNLLDNAIKHHDRKQGRIELSVLPPAPAAEMLTFAVKDDGPGIAPQFQDRIFNMFQTLRPRDQVEGSGMGLALVRKYVEVFGGSVWLDSAEGKGSTFHFTWPVQQPRIGQYTGRHPWNLPGQSRPNQSTSSSSTTTTATPKLSSAPSPAPKSPIPFAAPSTASRR